MSRRSPLTAWQEAELRRSANGVSIIFGSKAAGLVNLDSYLERAFGKSFFLHVTNASDLSGFGRVLDGLSQRQDDGTTLVLVSYSVHWTESWVKEALRRVQRLQSKTSFVRLAFVADALTTWQILADGDATFDQLTADGVTSLCLGPWHDAAVRQWLEDSACTPNDQQVRQAIANETGNWPFLLERFYQLSRTESHHWNWEQALGQLVTQLVDPAAGQSLLESFGIMHGEPRRVLRTMAQWGEIARADVVDLVGDFPPEIVRGCLRWADRLGLIVPAQASQ